MLQCRTLSSGFGWPFTCLHHGAGEVGITLGFLLVAISDMNRGGHWWVEAAAPLVLGRGADCDIILSDPIVSRRHCRIVLTDGEVHFEDLGSRNPVLVNGVPTEKGVLKPGNELSIGQHVFLLTSSEGEARWGVSDRDIPETVALDLGALDDFGAGLAELGKQGAIRTIHDLADLHNIGSDFSRAQTMDELLEFAGKWLGMRFDPLEFWIARVQGDKNPTFYQTTASKAESTAPPPLEVIGKALDEGRALLVREASAPHDAGGQVFTFAVPMMLNGVNIGVLVVQSKSLRVSKSERDLKFLALLAQSLAPSIYAIENVQQLRRENARLQSRAGESAMLVGQSRAIGKVRRQIAEAAGSELNVLISGETGTGKELVARMLHAQSSRSTRSLVVVNCAAIPRDLMESQLFGHEKGAFTGANEASAGLMVQADGGILFLDEVGDLSVESQARILRAIEEGTFRPVGAEQETYVDMRVIAATHRDLRAAIRAGDFREDLYHRLDGFQIPIPPLRERPSDIPILAEHFFNLCVADAKRPLSGIAPEVFEYLQSLSWSGNVRELRNCILRAVARARQDTIGLDDVSDQSGGSSTGVFEGDLLTLDEAEERHIVAVFEKCGHNVRDASKALEIGRSTLYKKLAEYGIQT